MPDCFDLRRRRRVNGSRIGRSGISIVIPRADDYLLPYTDDQLASGRINHRLIAVNTAADDGFSDGAPQDGSRMGIVDPYSRLGAFPITVDGNGRPIEGAASVVLNVDGTSREWFTGRTLAPGSSSRACLRPTKILSRLRST
jgi:hypothetical protein